MTMRALLLVLALTVGGPVTAVRAVGTGTCPETDAEQVALTLPATCRGSLSTTNEIDRYAIDLARGQRLVLRVAPVPPLIWTGVRLAAPDGVARPCAEAVAVDACDLRADLGGIWTLEISRESGEGAYALTGVTTSAHDDCVSGADAPDTVATAQPVFLEADPAGVRAVSCDGGRFDALDERDAFRFEMVAGVYVLIQMTARPGTVAAMELRDAAGVVQGSGTEVISTQAATGGAWSLLIRRGHAGGSGLPYAFTITTIQDDCGTGADIADPLVLDEPWRAGAPASRACSAIVDPAPATPSSTAPADPGDAYVFPRADPAVPGRIEVRAPAGTCIDLIVAASILRACDGELVTTKIEHGDVVRFDVTYRSGAGGPYSLQVWGIVPAQRDCGVDGDAGDAPASARALTGDRLATSPPQIVTSCQGQLRAGDADAYVVQVPARAAVALAVAAEDGGAPAACVLDAADVCAGMWHAVDAARAVTVLVGPRPAETAYTLTVTVLPQDDCGTGRDGADEPEDATPLATEACIAVAPPQARPPVTGQVQPPVDVADRFAVEVLNDVSGMTVALRPLRTDLDVDLCVTPPDAAPVCSSSPAGLTEMVAAVSCDPDRPDVSGVCRGVGSWVIAVTYRSGPPGAYEVLVGRRVD